MAELVEVPEVVLEGLELCLEALPVGEGRGRGGDGGGGAGEDAVDALLVRGHGGRDHGEIDEVGVGLDGRGGRLQFLDHLL